MLVDDAGLETLSPDERAVFVLRDVFGFDYDEIASAVGKSAAAVRQMAHRSREHVRARRKRFGPTDPEQSMALTAQFLTAATTGDVSGLMSLLAPDVVWTADSAGKVSAARRPVTGAANVARLLVGLFRIAGPDAHAEPAIYNSAPALVLYLGDRLEGVVSVDVVDGKITNFYAMRNPDKLTTVTVARRISR